MRPSTAKSVRPGAKQAETDEEVARQLALSEKQSTNDFVTPTGRLMTANTQKRFAEDEAIAWQVQYEEELGRNRPARPQTSHPDVSQMVSQQENGSSSSILSLGTPPQVASNDRLAGSPSPGFDADQGMQAEDDDDGYVQVDGYEKSDGVPSSLADILAILDTFEPEPISLPLKLACFTPDYFPAIGDVDSMIKLVPPASLKPRAGLGLLVLDEPSIHSSDPAVINLRLRITAKSTGTTNAKTHVPVLDPKKHDFSRSLAQWCQSVLDIHSKMNPDRVFYSKRMPSLEVLMTDWRNPLGLEPQNLPDNPDRVWQEVLRKWFQQPSGEDQFAFSDMDLELSELARLACLLVDIPVYTLPISTSQELKRNAKPMSSRACIESLHVFFGLYLEFKNSTHFGPRDPATS